MIFFKHCWNLVGDLQGHLFTLVASLKHGIFGTVSRGSRGVVVESTRHVRDDSAKCMQILMFFTTCSKQQKLHNQRACFFSWTDQGSENYGVGFLIKGNSASFCSTQQKLENGCVFSKESLLCIGPRCNIRNQPWISNFICLSDICALHSIHV